MGDRPTGEESVRKIMKTGGEDGSYMITLPKAYVKKLGWREKQKVDLTLKGDAIIIRDWKA